MIFQLTCEIGFSNSKTVSAPGRKRRLAPEYDLNEEELQKKRFTIRDHEDKTNCQM